MIRLLPAELQMIQGGIYPTSLQQFFVRAHFSYPALVQHDNQVSIFDSGQAVRDNECSPVFHDLSQCILYHAF
jgi:hypothetical protein